MIAIGKISKIDYEAGRADVTLEDREGIVITDVPFLDSIYEMPNIKDAVFVDMEEKGGRIIRSVILGRFYAKDNLPADSGKGIFYKKFSDGAYIKYDPDTKTLELGVDKVEIKELGIKDDITIDGSQTVKGEITIKKASGDINLSTHTHTGVHGETSGPH